MATQAEIDAYLARGKKIKRVASSKRGKITLRQKPAAASRTSWNHGNKAVSEPTYHEVKDRSWFFG